MDYTIIEVPEMNDSLSRVVLSDVYYQIRFTYNDTSDYWTFGLYDDQGEPIAVGIKIVPKIPLNLFFGVNVMPSGFFAVMTNLDRIGYEDFWNDNAKFIYVPVDTDTDTSTDDD